MRLSFVLVIVLACFAVTLAATPDAAPAATGDQSAPARCVLITGANRGLGLEFARQYAAAGWNVIGTARKPAEATDLIATGATVVTLDVTSDASVAQLARDLEGQAIDLLINNAGISGRTPSIDEFDASRTARVLDVNLLGPMRVTDALLKNLRAGTGKKIVAISSGLGSIENNRTGSYYGYRESKAGLNMFMRSLAAELRDEGFACAVLSPGWVRTDMGGPNATLSPEESITGMRKVIEGLTVEKTGRFINHDGNELPW